MNDDRAVVPHKKARTEVSSVTQDAADIPSLVECDVPMDVPLQWWYGNAILSCEGQQKRRFGFFTSFFRQCGDDVPTGESQFFDACTWALIDLEEHRYYSDSLLDERAINEIRKRIDPDFTGREPQHSEEALLRLINRGRLPRPDRLMQKKSTFTADPFCLNLSDESVLSITQTPSGREYHFRHSNAKRQVAVNLSFRVKGEPVQHGEDGIVNNMHYYFFPSARVTGTVTVPDHGEISVGGSGWYDREYGGETSVDGRDARDSWCWLSFHLSDKSELSLFRVTDKDGSTTKESVAVLTTASGQRTVCRDVELFVKHGWTSLTTYLTYPAQCELKIASISLHVDFAPAFAAQEFVTILVSGCGFYEGVVEGSGISGGVPISLEGFMEFKPPVTYQETGGLMKIVGQTVHALLTQFYPREPSEAFIRENVLGRHQHFVSAVPCAQIGKTLFQPVRSIIDRGGKSWRSLILVACCNALCPEYFDCRRYIAMAELLHVGSLIIDDIQDNSTLRRGGACVHTEYGVPTAINAGTQCYFMAPQLARIQDLPAAKARIIYELYFDVLRAGHAGQGLDIDGLFALMPDAVRTGTNEALIGALRAIHVLKTGGAAGTICRMACVLCDADTPTSDAVEKFGVMLGLAFQIIDDALNIKGFEENLKETAEDIRDGKITYPVAKALGNLTPDDRNTLWSDIQLKSSDPDNIRKIISLVIKGRGVEDSLKEARTIVKQSWEELDPFLPDSLSKNMMYTFCTFLVKQTL